MLPLNIQHFKSMDICDKKKHLVQYHFDKKEDKIMNLQKQNSLKFVCKDVLKNLKMQRH
jgi:hypothetical protein